MNDAFNVSGEQLLMILTENNSKDTDLVKMNNNSISVSKFCEMSLFLNIDPLQNWALHLVVILMCKNTNPMGVANRNVAGAHVFVPRWQSNLSPR
jgi:hypothetical protein